MARGWESKSVEDQQSGSFAGSARPSSDNMTNQEQKRASDHERAARERKRQALHLQRENVLSQRTSNPARRAALEAALADIDKQIQSLD